MLTWLALIVLWGSSEHWDPAELRRRAVHVVHTLHHDDRAHPFDWAEELTP